MKRLVITAIGAMTLFAASTLSPDDSCAGGSCSLKPLKPLVPLGCKDLVAVCQCDVNGRNCHWVWNCVN